MDTQALVQQIQGFRALAAELHLDIVDFCQDRALASSTMTGEQSVLDAISTMASHDADCVTACWQWLCRALRSTKHRHATPSDFLNLGMCQMYLYTSLLRRRPPALLKMAAGFGIEGFDTAVLPLPSEPRRPKEDIDPTHQQQQRRVTASPIQPRSGDNTPPQSLFHPVSIQHACDRAARDSLPPNNARPIPSPGAIAGPDIPLADAQVSTIRQATEDSPGSAGTPAPSDKYLAEIQEALGEPHNRDTTPAAQPVPETITSVADRGPLFEQALEAETAGVAAVHPPRTATAPSESGQHSASIAPTEPQATASAATGECLSHPGRPNQSLSAVRRARDEVPVDSPGKQPDDHRQPVPSQHATATAPRTAASSKAAQQQGCGDAGPPRRPDIAAHSSASGRRPHQPIQFVVPATTGTGMSLEQLSRSKSWVPGQKTSAPAASAPAAAALQTPVAKAPPPSGTGRYDVSKPATKVSRSSAAPRQEGERRWGIGDDIAQSSAKQHRADKGLQPAGGQGAREAPMPPRPEVPRRGPETDLRRAPPEERGEFIAKKPRLDASCGGHPRAGPDLRYSRSLPAARSAAEPSTRRAAAAAEQPLPGPPLRVRSPRSPPLLLADDDSDDERLPLRGASYLSPTGKGGPALGAPPRSGAAVGPAKIHVVDESDDEPLEQQWARGGAGHGPRTQAPPAGGTVAGRSGEEEFVLSGLTDAELANAENLMRYEMETFPPELRLDAFAEAAGAMYDSLLDTCKVYSRACVFCAQKHPKTKGQCERIRKMPRAQKERWRDIIAQRAKVRANVKAAGGRARPEWLP